MRPGLPQRGSPSAARARRLGYNPRPAMGRYRRLWRAGCLGFAVLCGAGGHALAQDSPTPLSDVFTFTTWTDKDGLPPGSIRAFAQDADGYLWLGGDAGVVRFDGLRFVPWDGLGLEPLPHRWISSLLAARDRSLWIGFIDGGAVARVKNGRVQIYDKPGEIGTTYTTSLIEDRSGAVWMASESGLHRFHHDRWEQVGSASGLPSEQALAVYEDSAQRVWVALRTAVFRRDRADSTFAQVDTLEEVPFFYSSFSEDRHGVVWTTDLRHGLRPAGVPAIRRRGGATGLGVGLLHDRGGHAWVATQGEGLWHLRDGADGRSPQILHATVESGLFGNRVRGIFEDRQRNVWVGMDSAVQRLSRRKVAALTDFGVPIDLAETPDGSVWIGTDKGGLTRVSKAGTRHYGRSDGLPDFRIVALDTDDRGTLWVVTASGILRFDGRAFVPARLKGAESLTRISAITSAAGRVWISDLAQGFFARDGDRLTRLDTLPSDFHRGLHAMAGDSHGTFWLSSSNGRLVALRADGALSHYTPGVGEVYSIFHDREGVTWVGGRNGLSRIENGTVLTLNRADALPPYITSISEDRSGVLWFGVRKGIVRLEKREFARAASDAGYRPRYQLLDASDGGAGVPLTRPPLRTADGRLWFMASGGITVVHPDTLGEYGTPPPLRIEAISVHGERQPSVADVRLPSRSTQVQIDFTALDLAHPHRVRFRYSLEPVDTGWVDGQNRRFAAYNNLGPGEYVFKLVATNDDGAATESTTQLAFSIAPTFYQRRSFYAAFLALFVMGTWGLWHVRARRARQQFALVLAERIRLSRAIHDTVLQGVAGLSLQFEELAKRDPAAVDRQDLSRIRKEMDDVVREARASIWELQSSVVPSPDLPTALERVGARITTGTAVQFSLRVTGEPFPCSQSFVRTVSAIAQEATLNATRHGRPTRIEVRLDYQDGCITLSVTDDGTGFDIETANRDRSHYGLISMRERAEEAGGSLELRSARGSGTTIRVVFPGPGRDQP